MHFFHIVVLGYLFHAVGCLSPDLNYDKTIMKTNLKLPYLFDNAHYPPPGIIPMLNRKVFRGRRVSIREHPYVASIRRNVAHYLVGTILSMNIILTIAHPLIDVSIAELSVVVGENYADRGAMLHTVIIKIVHEQFNQSSLEHDIALLRIYEDITFKGSAKSIPIHDYSVLVYGLKAFVTGWGRCDRTGRELCLPRSTRFTPGEKFDPMLRTVSFYTKVNTSYCEVYKNNGLYLGPGMICQGIGRGEDEVASCLAVPGAPLVTGGRLAGVLSWGFSCGHSSDLPLIYTSTQFYQSWIDHNIMILQDIPKVFLFKLFQAKKAYVLKEWLRLTRVEQKEFAKVDKSVKALYVDRYLERLLGTVYDIRDYINNGEYHQHKINLYKQMKQDIVANTEKEKYLAKIQEMYEARVKEIKPFLNSNFTNQDNRNFDYDV